LAIGISTPASAAEVKVDPAIGSYKEVPGISGNLVGVGSDTLNNMMDLWLTDFRKRYSNVTGSHKGEGSSTAPPALEEGVSQLGPMSRAMKDTELEKLEKKYGFPPTRITVALDCLAVFVHKDNPVKGLTLEQLDCIFSSTRNSGFRNISTWGSAGLSGEWANRPITLVGRNAASGTYGYFKKHALFGGDFKDSVREMPGSAAVVNTIGEDRAAIGYSGIGYLTAEVRAIPLCKGREKLAKPTFENALNGKYPLGRGLYIYVIRKPKQPLPPLVGEFLKFVLSKEGQQIVVKDGFGPLPASAVKKQLELLK
jgi:phosphate transport system substrate-binding protein